MLAPPNHALTPHKIYSRNFKEGVLETIIQGLGFVLETLIPRFEGVFETIIQGLGFVLETLVPRFELHMVAMNAGMHHNEWMENADRWVASFLEKFEECCHIMESAIKVRIQEKLRRRKRKIMNANNLHEPVAAS